MNLGKPIRVYTVPEPIVAPVFTPPPAKPAPAPEPEREREREPELVPVRQKGSKGSK
jgi:hypothetical protein